MEGEFFHLRHSAGQGLKVIIIDILSATLTQCILSYLDFGA